MVANNGSDLENANMVTATNPKSATLKLVQLGLSGRHGLLAPNLAELELEPSHDRA